MYWKPFSWGHAKYKMGFYMSLLTLVLIAFFFSIFLFLMWTIFKGFTEFVTILLPFYISVFWPQDTWYLSFPTRDQISTPFIERLSLNHWPIREVPSSGCYFSDQLQLWKITIVFLVTKGFPDGSDHKEPACQCRRPKRPGFFPWVGTIPWRRKWQPTPVFLPGEFHGHGSLVGSNPWGRKESDTTA